jgi:hypothetical protein
MRIGIKASYVEFRRRTSARKEAARPAKVWYLSKAGIAYVHVPKVATRSIRRSLTVYAAVKERGRSASLSHPTPGDIQMMITRHERLLTPAQIWQLSQVCETFTFVRNPLDRLYSCYRNKVHLQETQNTFWKHQMDLHATFEEFVERVAEIPDELADRHIRSQHRFLFDGDRLSVRFLGRFESLQKDWISLGQLYDLPRLPHRNRSGDESYREAYTPEMARLAASRYRRDIDLLGYGPEVQEFLQQCDSSSKRHVPPDSL